MPASLEITQSSTASASFNIGFPAEHEGNGTRETANPLPLDGYAYGVIASSTDVDVFRVQIPEDAAVVVETDGHLGACGLAGQVDTVVRILSDVGGLVAESDDIDSAAFRYCSRLQLTLPAGTYYIEVRGWNGHVGSYAVRVGKP
jgi:hypothetical protein